MLDQIKYSLQNAVKIIDSSIGLSIDDIEVSLLFDEKGDFTTNIALKLSKLLKQRPLDLAKLIIKNISSNEFEKIEVAGPGFINFFLKDQFFLKLLNDDKRRFQDQSTVNIEFVSANPTGPLHLAHGRGAIVGDVLSNLYQFFGHKVTREYYVNNTGNQINEFLSSILFHISSIHHLDLSYKQFYKGDYIKDLAEKCFENFQDIFKSKQISKEQELKIVNYAIENLVNLSIQTLQKSGIVFDKVSYETSIVEKKLLPEIITELQKKDLVYRGQLHDPKNFQGTKKDNEITIFKSTHFGDDEDRALTKNDGSPTYFANDIAYHVDKYNRGYSRLINIWGADHLGYLKRLSSALTALYSDIDFSVVFCQIVNLKRNNEIQKMSKREGTIFELDKLVNEIGIENYRYFMCYRKNDTHMDLDIDLIKKENKENPIYYIQYSFARSQSVLDRANKLVSKSLNLSPELKNLFKKNT
ncbi:arginine--tRNA ligase [Alphaproteobacteria bacterium]|nr:arginine--tRNA ligase [Alphaproteobacteria bacterium]